MTIANVGPSNISYWETTMDIPPLTFHPDRHAENRSFHHDRGFKLLSLSW